MRSLSIRSLAPAIVTWSLVAAPALADDVTVKVSHGKLDPAAVTIAVGDTVTFVNVVAMPGGHSVAAKDGLFTSPALDKDGQWSYTFEEAGVFSYQIVEHPEGVGTITVK